MLALIAGSGALPAALIAALDERPLVCAMETSAPEVPVDLRFRLERLGGFLNDLQRRGITTICMAGAVTRPPVDLALIDADTRPLVPRIETALRSGDDAALRAIISIFEEAGFDMRAAHEIAPDLLPRAGVLTEITPNTKTDAEAVLAEETIAIMGAADIGQACVLRDGQVLAREDQSGTDAMLARLATAQDARGAILFKAAKPGQDRRADLPVIGPGTARGAIAAGLAGIVIETGSVMVLQQDTVTGLLNEAGMFLWVRPRGAP